MKLTQKSDRPCFRVLSALQVQWAQASQGVPDEWQVRLVRSLQTQVAHGLSDALFGALTSPAQPWSAHNAKPSCICR